MISESARSTTAAESRFRVQAPNAAARSILVIGLDPACLRLIGGLQGEGWHGLRFVDASRWRPALEEQAADVVIIVSSADQSAEAAREIGSHALERAIKVSAVLLRDGANADAVSRSLQQLRPWAQTLMLLEDEADLRSVLHALGG
jgi:hypothetical protein